MTALNTLTAREIERYYPREEASGFGALSTARGTLPLKAMDVRAKIDGLIASTEIRQTFVNTIGEPLEATYIFPLPDRAAVTRFQMEVAGRVVEGIIKERGQARQDYDRAIAEGKRAAITEEDRAGVFTIRVGNIMPGEAATVTLTLVGPLPYDEGEATFRFPLVVAPRYIPGTALGGDDVGDGVERDTDAVPDASRITPPVLLPGYPNPVRLSLEVELAGVLPISDLRSSLHSMMEDVPGFGVRRIRLHAGERLDRDFILRFKLGGSGVTSALELKADGPGSNEGTFLLTLVPPTNLPRSQKPRDVIFVLDRSGSMEGWKMIAARRAVGRMVDSLGQSDNFGVLAFDDQIETPSQFPMKSLVEASNKNRFRAIEFLATVNSRGGTEMKDPLELAAGILAGGYQDREKVIVLVTDGQVGNEDQILRNIASRLRNVRVFALGIDRAVNESFLRKLADIGGGLSEIVESEDRLDEVMDRMHRRIGTPVVTECNLIPSGLEALAGTVVPRRLPDLFAGAPITISGRYRGAPRGNLEVRGRDAHGAAWAMLVHGRETTNAAVTAVWARGQVRELEDRFIVSGGSSGMEQEIVRISLRFGVLSRFTAFLAVDRERANASGQMHRVIQAVEAPEGWDMLGKGSAPARSMAAPAPAVGRVASGAGLRGSAAPPAARAKASFQSRAAPAQDRGFEDPMGEDVAASRMESSASEFLEDFDDSAPDSDLEQDSFQLPAPKASPTKVNRRVSSPAPAPAKKKAEYVRSTVIQPEARVHAEQMQRWLEDQLAAGSTAWPSALTTLQSELLTLAKLLEHDDAGIEVYVRVQALLRELGDLVRASFDQRRAIDFFDRLREVLEAVSPESSRPAPGRRRSSNFWKA